MLCSLGGSRFTGGQQTPTSDRLFGFRARLGGGCLSSVFDVARREGRVGDAVANIVAYDDDQQQTRAQLFRTITHEAGVYIIDRRERASAFLSQGVIFYYYYYYKATCIYIKYVAYDDDEARIAFGVVKRPARGNAIV